MAELSKNISDLNKVGAAALLQARLQPPPQRFPVRLRRSGRSARRSRHPDSPAAPASTPEVPAEAASTPGMLRPLLIPLRLHLPPRHLHQRARTQGGRAPPPPIEEPSFLDGLMEDPMIPLAGGGLLALLIGYGAYRVVQRRRGAGGVDSSFHGKPHSA